VNAFALYRERHIDLAMAWKYVAHVLPGRQGFVGSLKFHAESAQRYLHFDRVNCRGQICIEPSL
ncbi:MAG: hypothetical protein OER87_19910, partial [Gammaproteobacteria bacterium]|nr:hypothetical protein [Gammaproteobacteria bacterium]